MNEKATASLNEALHYDPYSMEMLGAYTQYANYYGNKTEAAIAYKRLEKIGPNSNALKELRKLDWTSKLKETRKD